MSRHSRPAGELLLVVLGLLAAIAVLGFSVTGSVDRRVSEAARAVGADVAAARQAE